MNTKRILLPLALLLMVFGSLQAQFGVSGYYLSGQAENWEYDPPLSSLDRVEFPGNGWQVGVDYWFRLKNTRIEFLPTLAFTQQEQTIGSEPITLDAQMQGIHFFFNTNIYLLDLAGDCDCPTFSKEGPTLEKGFFLQLSPGYSLFNFDMTDNGTGTSYEADDSAFSIGFGLGFDLGLSDFFTLSPMLGARYYPEVSWETLGGEQGLVFPGEVSAESDLLQYQLGLRMGFRLDN